MVFNVTYVGQDVVLSGDSVGNATFVNVEGKVTVSGDGASLGAFYAAGLDPSGSASFSGRPFHCDCTSIDPALLGTNVQRPAAPTNRGLGNAPFYLASYNFQSEEGKLETISKHEK